MPRWDRPWGEVAEQGAGGALILLAEQAEVLGAASGPLEGGAGLADATLTGQALAASRMPRVANALSQAPGLSALATRLGSPGTAASRCSPRGRRVLVRPGRAARGRRPRQVLLWPDTFTNHFDPGIGPAAVEVLATARWQVALPDQPQCCGLRLAVDLGRQDPE